MKNENPFYVAAYVAPFDSPLGGRWFDLAGRDADSFAGDVASAFGDDVETRVFDVENVPACLLQEGVLLPETWEFLGLDDGERATVWAYWENVEPLCNVSDVLDSYQGTGDNPKDWAWDWLEETGDLQFQHAILRNYFDFEAFAHDLKCEGWAFVRRDGNLFVFRPM